MSTPRAHDDACVVFCTDTNDGDDPEVHTFHGCWCRDGGLSYDEFKAQHPEWALLDSYDWLGVAQGKQWRRDMEAN